MTQLESAVAGVVTKEMKVVAEKERMDELLRVGHQVPHDRGQQGN